MFHGKKRETPCRKQRKITENVINDPYSLVIFEYPKTVYSMMHFLSEIRNERHQMPTEII